MTSRNSSSTSPKTTSRTGVHLCRVVDGALDAQWTSRVVASFSTIDQARTYLRSDTFIRDFRTQANAHTDPPIFFLLSEGQLFYLEPTELSRAVEIETLPLYDSPAQA